MAVMRDRPYGNSNFLVDLGWGDSRSVSRGFAEVILPTFIVGNPESRQDVPTAAQGSGPTDSPRENHIILKRGFIGDLDLYEWWHKARRGKAPQRRTMKVELLSEDGSTVVATWRFRNVRPVSLSYSPLRAIEGGILMETIVLAFESMEMA